MFLTYMNSAFHYSCMQMPSVACLDVLYFRVVIQQSCYLCSEKALQFTNSTHKQMVIVLNRYSVCIRHP
jgi:hypothetical protein